MDRLRSKVKSIVSVVSEGGPYHPFYLLARATYHSLYLLLRSLSQTDRRLVDDYLKKTTVRKLHIGCGDPDALAKRPIFPDWLNSDYYPKSPKILHLDATRPFRLFESGSFDYVFSEHMIEHIPYSAGVHMMADCYRILKPHGKMRTSTPDLAFLIDLYRNDKSTLQDQFLAYASSNIKWVPYKEDTFVINNFVRDWGHQFIWDEKTMRTAMEKVGFKNVTSYKLQRSDDTALRNLEHETRMPEGFLQLQTFTMEGEK